MQPRLLRPLTRAPLALLFGALGGALMIRSCVLHGHVRWADESSSLWQAEVFASGRLWAPAPPGGSAVVGTWIVQMGSRTYSMYPPGWSGLLAVFRIAGLASLVNVILFVLLLALCMREARILGSRSSAVLCGLLFGTSPFALFMAGTAYSHLFSALLLTTCVFMLVPRDEDVAGRWRWVASGLLLGCAVLVRPYTAVSFACGAGLGLLVAVSHRRLLLLHSLLLLPGLTLGTGLLLLHNALLSGNALLFGHLTQRAAQTSFGVGGQGPFFAGVYLLLMLLWGVAAVPFLTAYGVLHREDLGAPQRRLVLAAAGGFAGLVVGYSLFQTWQSGGYGPRFLFEAYPLLCVSASLVLRRSPLKTDRRVTARALRFLFAWSFLFTVLVALPAKVVKVESEIRPLLVVDEFARGLDHPALLFICRKYSDLVRNPPDEPGLLVRARHVPGREEGVIKAYPGRRTYLLGDSGRIQPWESPN